MTESDQIEHLANDIDGLIDRYRSEYDISYAAIIGVLHLKAHTLCEEVVVIASDDDDDDSSICDLMNLPE